MEIIGYKCFNEDLTNRYGIKYEIGKIYSKKGQITYGNNGHGFHFCKNLEDTLRYFNGVDEEISICLVKGFGNIVEYEDEYNGYYDMYSSENIEIIKKLDRNEIINYAINLNEIRVCRFIQCFKLNNDEIELFKERFSNLKRVLQYLNYYQLNEKDAFKSL